MMFCEKVPIV